ncbi:hypothetical protein PM082_007586 [Marasmius tenuissimus]|nr:hypothetical protein PM082_007586 [Marasmius tenuissimus]
MSRNGLLLWWSQGIMLRWPNVQRWDLPEAGRSQCEERVRSYLTEQPRPRSVKSKKRPAWRTNFAAMD